jgi:hypothetical protein
VNKKLQMKTAAPAKPAGAAVFAVTKRTADDRLCSKRVQKRQNCTLKIREKREK